MLSQLSNSNLFETANFSGAKGFSNFSFKENILKNPFINPIAAFNPKNFNNTIKPAVQKLDGSEKEKQAIIDAANQATEAAYAQGAADAITTMANQAANSTVQPVADATTYAKTNDTIAGMPSKVVYIGGTIILAIAAFAIIRSYKN